MVSKICKKCLINLDISFFNNQKLGKYGKNSKCKSCCEQERKIWRIKNKNSILNYQNIYRQNNIELVRKNRRLYERQKYNQDINYKLAHNLRIRLNRALKGLSSESVLDLTGCSLEFLKLRLESLFDQRMSWNNYGKWHIDHIIPCSFFELENSEERQACFHYTNLSPLWAKDNLKKSNKGIK